MTTVDADLIPQEIIQDSLLARIAGAYFSVGRRLERITGCSATRGFILSTLRDGAVLNQNQIATRLGFDRTVVHRAIKSLAQEGLVSEKKANSGKAILVALTSKGEKYRSHLIAQRRAADERIRQQLTPEDHAALVRLLKLVTEVEF
jgi:DNA-binding MarR family transcriptional regulator